MTREGKNNNNEKQITLKTLYKLAQHFKETRLPDYELELRQRLRLPDHIIVPLTKSTADLLLELPEEMLPYYCQCQETIPLIVCRENYLKIIEDALAIHPGTDLEDIDAYLPKIYLIHQTNSVSIQNPWRLR